MDKFLYISIFLGNTLFPQSTYLQTACSSTWHTLSLSHSLSTVKAPINTAGTADMFCYSASPERNQLHLCESDLFSLVLQLAVGGMVTLLSVPVINMFTHVAVVFCLCYCAMVGESLGSLWIKWWQFPSESQGGFAFLCVYYSKNLICWFSDL